MRSPKSPAPDPDVDAVVRAVAERRFQSAADRIDAIVATLPVPAAQLALAEALGHLLADDRPAAITALREAEAAARRAEDVPSYVAAKLAVAQLLEEAGDRVAGYGELATGWVTLRERVDPDLARAAFRPALRELSQRWGAEELETVRAEFLARRGGTAGG